VAVNPTTNRIYVAHTSSPAYLRVIDGVANAVVSTVEVGAKPYGLAVNPVTNRIYVPSYGSGDPSVMSVIDGTTDSVVAAVLLPQGRYGVAVNPATNRVYVAGDPNIVTVIDGVSNTVSDQVAVGSNPWGVAIDSETDRIYVASWTGVSVIDGVTDTVVATIPAAFGPEGIAVNPNTNLIYVANLLGDSVSVINGASNTVVASVAVGSTPMAVAVNPNTNLIYVANYWSNSVSVIEGASNMVVSTMAVGNGPDSVAVNPDTNLIYVTNYGDGTVSVIEDTPTTDTPTPVPTGTFTPTPNTYAYWHDEFDGTSIDQSRWITELATSGIRFHNDCGGCNTGYWTTPPVDPPYGSLSIDGSILTLLNPGLPRVFPFLWSRGDPFPTDGDFSLEIRMKYNYFGGSGTGLVLSANGYDGSGDAPNPLEERVFTIWQDIAHPLVSGFPTDSRQVTGALDTDWHLYRVEYVAGSYFLFVDNILRIGPIASTQRPNSIWVGNPVITSATWDESTTFSVDYIRVEVPGASPSPTLTPMPTATFTSVPPTATFTPRPATPTPPHPSGVGGKVMLPPAAIAAESHASAEQSGWSAGAYVALAVGLSAAFAALAAGGWYARRRWPDRR
jgi:YVTN family beta-propeller protein